MFNFLKNKLKQWLGKSKEKIQETAEIVETPEVEVKEKQIKEKTKKQKKKKQKQIQKEQIIEEFPEVKPKESAIEIEQEIEQGITEKDKKEIIKEEEREIKKELEEDIKEQEKEEEQEKEFAKRTAPTIEELKEKQIEKKGFFARIKEKFTYKLTQDKFNDIFEDLEMLLLENNVAYEAVEDIKKKLGQRLIGKEISKSNLEEEIKKELKSSLNEILIDPDDPLDVIKQKKKNHEPFVILFFGINGTGKTTSIAKIAHLLTKNKISVVLAAADTFRAASIEQIQIHADKLGVKLIKQDYGADPAAVGFDAIKYAKNHKIDAVLIDTAGRMHTRDNLISEMEKIVRVTNPDLKIFVAESIAGNDATEQAKTFNEAIEIDGSILSKTDVDEKGGTIISVSHATHKPIFYLGTGQGYEDLKLFNKEKFIDDLLS